MLMWLARCRKSHIACRREDGDRFVPSRILHVDELRIVPKEDLEKQNHRYAALSHSWGEKADRKRPIPKTTLRNYDERKVGISWDEFTKTFQDAIEVTRRLGLTHLWIDSLCIIQDSDEDWTEQSMQMAKIYGGATIVIAATKSKNGDVGIFQERGPTFKFHVPDIAEPVTLQERLTHQNFFIAHKPNFDREPLFSRGWCYQERLMARRVLHFTQDEMVWECNTELDCECQGIKLEAEHRTEGNNARKEFKAKYTTLIHSPDDEERKQSWMHMIEGYSERGLSFESDRLPALSGIAQQVASTVQGRYLAGMWEVDLPESLLWYPPMKDRRFRENVKREESIPSWAWPAIGIGITPNYERSRAHETVAKVIEIHCTPASSDPFGKIDGGFITLEAPVVEALYHEDERGICCLIYPQDPQDRRQIWPDSYLKGYVPQQNEVVLCVGIELDLRPENATGFKSVIVRSAEQKGQYLRIAQMNCPTQWSQTAELRLITIV